MFGGVCMLTRVGVSSGLAALAIFLATNSVHAEVAPRAPEVTTSSGVLRGVMADGVTIFRGIPFAASTAGEGRWRPPAPAYPWDGVRDASRHGPACPQSVARGNRVAAFGMDEDCLSLAVYSPQLDAQTKAPVMVWIHGGNARFGSGALYDGSALARRGVVVVTINYRLDRLGLFAHPSLTAAQSDEPLANYGLMDMMAALDWVQANIATFGGDPDNVTIFGQSSGSVAVTALMASPLSAGKFHKAIAQSGNVSIDYPRYLSRSTPAAMSLEADGGAMARALGLPADKEADGLRALPWQDVLAYTETEMANAMIPVIDGRVLPDNPGRIFREGRNQPAALMIGSTSWEEGVAARFPLPLDSVLHGQDPSEARAVYGSLDDRELAQKWFSDTAFHAPAQFLAAETARQGRAAYVYRYAFLSSERRGRQPGANHGDEVPLVFGSQFSEGQGDADDIAISNLLGEYWTNFAKNGDPNRNGSTDWPAYRLDGESVLIIDQTRSVQSYRSDPQIRYHMERYEAIVTANDD